MFFNTTAMTDQELLDKTTEVHKRLAYAQRFSGDPMLINTLTGMAEACAFEATERANKRMFDMMVAGKPDERDLTASPKVKPKTNGQTISDNIKREGAVRIMRTSRPVKE